MNDFTNFVADLNKRLAQQKKWIMKNIDKNDPYIDENLEEIVLRRNDVLEELMEIYDICEPNEIGNIQRRVRDYQFDLIAEILEEIE